jgi:flagellar hook-associated protein 2
MSTTPISTSNSATGAPLINFSGLASGIDTGALVTQLMAVESQPLNKMTAQKSLVQTRQSILQNFQTRLQSVDNAAQTLKSVTLFTQTQGVDSSDPSKVVASTASGAGVGGYQVGVTQLANAAQRTYAFTSPASAGTITIDGHDTALAAGASISDLVSAIDSDTNATVYAAATDSGTLVLSSRQTGDTGTGFIAVTDGTGALTEQTAKARQGRDALYSVDGVAGSSHTNVVTNAIAGVSLTLKSLTTTSGDVTVSVSPPGASVSAIKSALQSFVGVYNSTVDAIRAKLTEKSVPNATTAADQAKGVLFGDTQLQDLLATMRQAVYQPIAGLPEGMNSLADLGISTGDPSATVSQGALDGDLTIDDTKLTAALTTNPNGVRDLLMGTSGTTPTTGWGSSFDAIVHSAATTGGLLATSISSAGDQLKDLSDQIAAMQDRLALHEQTLRAQFTALETALSQSQAQSQWLTGQLNALSQGFN